MGKLRLPLGILWLILVTVLLTIPGSSLPSEDWFSKIWMDKWIHVGLFAIGVILWCRTKSLRVVILVAIIGLAYGTGMEFIQKYFVPGRSFDIGDIVADGAGCALGAIFSTRRYIKK